MSESENQSLQCREGRWTADEHQRFVEAFERYGKNYKKIADEIETRDKIQVRSHAQKYLLKQKKPRSAQNEPQQKPSDSKTKNSEEYKSYYKSWMHYTMLASHYYQLMQTLETGNLGVQSASFEKSSAESSQQTADRSD